MSGMKFRLQCSSCGSVFFETDRKARYCQKCTKKRPAKAAPVTAQTVAKPTAPPARLVSKASRLAGAAVKTPVKTPVKTHKEMEKKPAKADDSTPELAERVEKIYREEFEGKDLPRAEMVKQISDRIWLKRTVVSALIQKLEQPEIE